MGALFGKQKGAEKPKKQSRITDQDRAILELKTARDKAQQYKKRVCELWDTLCGTL
jgi:hypothetical protein